LAEHCDIGDGRQVSLPDTLDFIGLCNRSIIKAMNIYKKNETRGQYKIFICGILAGLLNSPKKLSAMSHSSDFQVCLSIFKESVAVEHAVYLVAKYIKSPEQKQISQRRLMQFPAEILIFVGQRMLTESSPDSLYKAIVVYTMASFKDKRYQKQLKYLLRTLIQNQRADEFERLIEGK
jgi:hypothetical protein